MTDFQTLSRTVTEYNSRTYTERVALRDIEMVDNRHISLRGEVITLSKTALSQLFSILGISQKFSDRLWNMDRELWDKVTTRLKQSNVSIILNIYIEDDGTGHKESILRAFTTTRNDVSDAFVLDSFEKILETSDVNFQGEFQPSTGTIVGLFIRKDKIDITDKGIEIFKPGAAITTSSLGLESSVIREYLYREVCSNGSMAQNNTRTRRILRRDFMKDDIVEKAKSIINMDSTKDYYKDAITNMQKVNASVSEMLTASRYLNFLKTSNKTLYEELFPIEDLETRYGTKFATKSEKWLGTADSLVNYYDMFNTVTYHATHSDISPVERKNIQIYAGSLLTRTPDLLDRAPSLN